ncbi:hypothetical protein [Clavibacter sp. km1a]|uniref:hypothetical protein n=1 Tax=Clavibacter sp. km1a TaxID=3459136 RepID=UPI004041CF8F
MRRKRSVAVLLSVVTALAGGVVVVGEGHRMGWFGVGGYDCDGRAVSQAAYDERRPASDLDEGTRAGFLEVMQRDHDVADLSAKGGWFVVAEAPARVMIMRELDDPHELENGEIVPDHEVLGIVRAASSTSGWDRETSSPCPLRRDLGRFSAPTVTFDSVPDPDSMVLELQVWEHACNSGEDAAGRVEIVALREFEDRVEVGIGVRPDSGRGFVTCQSNPATPFAVALEAPLGTRRIIDVGLAKPRPFEIRPIG